MSARHHCILSESRLLCWIEQLSHSELSWWWATVWKWAVSEAADACQRANNRYQSCGALFIFSPPVNSQTRAYSRVLRSCRYLFFDWNGRSRYLSLMPECHLSPLSHCDKQARVGNLAEQIRRILNPVDLHPDPESSYRRSKIWKVTSHLNLED